MLLKSTLQKNVIYKKIIVTLVIQVKLETREWNLSKLSQKNEVFYLKSIFLITSLGGENIFANYTRKRNYHYHNLYYLNI